MTLLGASAGSGTPGASPLLASDGTAEAPSSGILGGDRPAVARAQVSPGRGVQKDGSFHFRRHTEWADDLPTTAYCAFCPDVAFSGTARECVEWNAQHRRQVHPALKSVGVRERQQAAKRHNYTQKREVAA